MIGDDADRDSGIEQAAAHQEQAVRDRVPSGLGKEERAAESDEKNQAADSAHCEARAEAPLVGTAADADKGPDKKQAEKDEQESGRQEKLVVQRADEEADDGHYGAQSADGI